MRAKVSITGMVSSVPNAAMLTKVALVAANTRLREAVQAKHTQAFDVGGHQLHGGLEWVPLAPWTIADKRRKGFPRPSAPLYRTGAMQRAQRVTINLRQFPGGVRYTITTWNNKLYSQPHQTGFNNVWTGTFTPARPPSKITALDLEFVADTIRAYMRPDKYKKPTKWKPSLGPGKFGPKRK